MQDNIPEQLILKYLSREASADDVYRLHEWLAKDSSHQEILESYREAYDQPYEDTMVFSADRGLDLLNKKIEQHKHRTRRLSVRRTVWAIAAVFTVLAIAFVSFYAGQTDSPHTAAYIEKSNPYGQKSTFRLSDGSVIKLNSGSRLQFSEIFTETERRVILSGEAFFEVAHDPERPFIVQADGFSTTVLGTSFNIRAFQEDEEAVISVVTGRVQVANNAGNSIVLTPAQEAVYDKEQNSLVRQPSQLERVLAWKENTLWFEKSTMQQVARELEKWYGLTVSFTSEEVRTCRLTGSFKNESLTNVLRSIKLSTGINYEKTENTVVFSGHGCK